MEARDLARALWITAPGQAQLRSEPLAQPRAGQASVQTLFSGVSRGTEALVFAGRVPVSEHERMRAPFQSGDFPAPVKYGYANVGQVVLGPSELLGQLVFCLYPHQERYVVPCEALHALPPEVPAERAILAANLESALNGIWDAAIAPGDRVSVIGAGSIGCLSAWLVAQIIGCEVELIDVNAQRAEIARELGVRFATPGRARSEADVILHASGSSEGLALALQLAGFEASIIELSWYADHPVQLPLGGPFHSRRLTLRSSQVGNVATTHRSRWTTRRRLTLALSLLADSRLDALINSEGSFEELPQTMARLAHGPGQVIMHRVRYAAR
jgi:NADPH:quinone reductase-like Zn-dependent oxidoreductase